MPGWRDETPEQEKMPRSQHSRVAGSQQGRPSLRPSCTEALQRLPEAPRQQELPRTCRPEPRRSPIKEQDLGVPCAGQQAGAREGAFTCTWRHAPGYVHTCAFLPVRIDAWFCICSQVKVRVLMHPWPCHLASPTPPLAAGHWPSNQQDGKEERSLAALFRCLLLAESSGGTSSDCSLHPTDWKCLCSSHLTPGAGDFSRIQMQS